MVTPSDDLDPDGCAISLRSTEKWNRFGNSLGLTSPAATCAAHLFASTEKLHCPRKVRNSFRNFIPSTDLAVDDSISASLDHGAFLCHLLILSRSGRCICTT
jgi:hypothetical protein